MSVCIPRTGAPGAYIVFSSCIIHYHFMGFFVDSVNECYVKIPGTLSIGPTSIPLARVKSAADIWVTNVLGRTFAHCCSSIVVTDSSLIRAVIQL